MDVARLTAALANRNVAAFLYVLAACEGTSGPNGYRTLFGGGLFDSLDDHPRIKFWEKDDEFIRNGRKDFTTAAGRYQFTASTWDALRSKGLPLPDFSQASQDLAAVALIDGRGALDDVIAGRLDAALAKCAPEWASLPGAPYGQPTRSLAYCRMVYQQQLGALASDTQPAAPIEDRSTPYKEPAMPLPLLALIGTFGPLIAQMIPQVAKLFAKPDSPNTTRNIDAIQIVFDTIQKATSTTNLQSAIEAMAADPTVKAAAQQAVVTEPAIMAVLEIGADGIKAAREMNIAIAQADKPLYKNPAMVIAFVMLPLVYIVTLSVLFAGDAGSYWKGFWGPGFMPETRSATVNLILGMVLGGIMGFFFGTTFGSGRKTELIAGQEHKP